MERLLASVRRAAASPHAPKYAAGIALVVVAASMSRSMRRQRPPVARPAGKDKREKAEVNKEFFVRLRKLLSIVLPGLRSKEFLLLLLHTLFLVARTFVSIYVAMLDGEIVKRIVDRQVGQFFMSVGKWLAIAIPAVYINSMIRYLESKLSIAFRTRLVEHVYGLYMSNQTYYRVENLDSRLQNADQCLTEDVSRFCSMLAHLHSQLSKPVLDIVLMSAQLWFLGMQEGKKKHSDNFGPLAIIISVVYMTAKLLKLMTPPFGKLAAEQGAREGNLRFVHARLITHAEEIAFYGGHEIEKSVLKQAYLSLVKHMNTIFKSRILYIMVEGFLMKYVWSAAGLVMIALPIFSSATRGTTPEGAPTPSVAQEGAGDISNRTQHFVISRKLMTDGGDAIERLMSAWKEVAELAGYTQRVDEMLTVFEDVRNERYKKTLVNNDWVPGSGKVVEGDSIILQNVPIVTPNNDCLLKSISLEIKPGMHLLITGPNGCGKSSLFRMVGGLWPICGGVLQKPKLSDIFYIPQRPYLSLGCLREQVIYPQTVEEFRSSGMTDKDLDAIMDWVHLTHIVQRPGGWDAVCDWADVLSGGEKQRIGMARLFFHKPRFAFLDECTSAVSIDVEGKMYQHAIDIGVTLLTVTHRPTLWKFHNYLLQFDGEGGTRFTALNADARLSLKEEKTKLEDALADVPKKQSRLRELCHILGEDSVLLQRTQSGNNLSELAPDDAGRPDS